MQIFIQILTACVPIAVALVGIIPTVIANRKKTEESLKAGQTATETRISTLQTTLNNHIREDEDGRARNARYRILRFYDEMCEHRKHSESHFEDILEDIDAYELYCSTHPDFRNSRGAAAMHSIRDAYERIKINGGFLTHNDKEG